VPALQHQRHQQARIALVTTLTVAGMALVRHLLSPRFPVQAITIAGSSVACVLYTLYKVRRGRGEGRVVRRGHAGPAKVQHSAATHAPRALSSRCASLTHTHTTHYRPTLPPPQLEWEHATIGRQEKAVMSLLAVLSAVVSLVLLLLLPPGRLAFSCGDATLEATTRMAELVRQRFGDQVRRHARPAGAAACAPHVGSPHARTRP
jgi:hypothetical protein